MRLAPIISENWKADGGACFSVVPKTIWSKFIEADQDNLIQLTNRCLFVEYKDKKILIDCGMGRKQDEKFFKFKYLFGNEDLLSSLSFNNIAPEEITDLILTHLHQDHCGGAIKYAADRKELLPTFPNARLWLSKDQWLSANNPNIREKPSYPAENIKPLVDLYNTTFIEKDSTFNEVISFRLFNGHTSGQVIPFISYKDRTLVFMADFIPSTAHIPIVYLASFDIRPLIALEEKMAFLEEASKYEYILFFEHDFDHECCTIEKSNKGFVLKKRFNLDSIT